MQDVWRLFAAIELPQDVRERIAQVSQRLAAAGWRAKWVNPQGTHLTLKFYGNVPVDNIPVLRETLRPIVALGRPFELSAEGAGVFPNPRRPRVVWLGVGGDLESLGRLQRDIERASAEIGYEPEQRAFNPHLTVARIRPEDLSTVNGVEQRLAEIAALPPLPLPVERVALFRSELRRSGAVYTVVEEFPLGGETE